MGIFSLDMSKPVEIRLNSEYAEDKKIFDEKFAKDFILYTKDEVINKQIFGEGKENKYLKGAIGDFVALAISNKYFRSNKNCKKKRFGNSNSI